MKGRPTSEFWRCRRGATALEYGMVAGAVALVVAAAILALGGSIGGLLGVPGVLAAQGDDSGEDTAEMRLVLRQTFATDRAGWNGLAPVRTLDRIGTGLTLSRESRLGNARESLSRTFDIPAGSRRAQISFDMSFVDSWDGELAKVYVNGTEVIVGAHDWNAVAPPVLATSPSAGMRIETQMTNSLQAGPWTGGSLGTDHTFRVTIDVDDPGDTVALGFGTSLDQDDTDESLLIGNVELRAGP